MIRRVPADWVVAPDERSTKQLTAALNDDVRAGAVLIGPVGVGKTRLADTAAHRFAAAHPSARIARIVGTGSARNVPFDAVAHLVDVAGAEKTPELLRAARASLRRPDGGELLIVVDDAHDLDKLSATLVYQLAVSRGARLIVTVDSEEPVPNAVSALWTDDVLTRIDVGGTVLDGRSASVKELGEQVRQALGYLAVHDPLSHADLVALSGAQAVDLAVGEGAIRVERAGDDRIVRAGHPLYTDTVRAGLSAADARRLRAALVARLLARPRGDVVARLRLAALAVDSDTPGPPAEAVAAALEALRLGDMELGERLARAALDRSRRAARAVGAGHHARVAGPRP